MEKPYPIFSVMQVSLLLRDVVETAFSNIQVKGEVSGIKKASSGHVYFSIKDTEAVLSAICWRGLASGLQDVLVEGLEVICTGKISTYPGRSNYQMIVEHAEPAGIGALLKQLEELKRKLADEGLFNASRKKKIPYLPETIGVITSSTGAVIRDIMHRLKDRCGRTVYLWPVLVQGQGASDQIVAAIDGFSNLPKTGGIIPRPDVLIVARGGGSLEDLWSFNEEKVARAVVRCTIPLISAVGHETDTTLIDFVSDLRVPTPTAAAEKAVPVRHELISQLDKNEMRLREGLYRWIHEKKIYVEGLSRDLPRLTDMIVQYTQRLDDKEERFHLAFSTFFQREVDKVKGLGRLLDAHSYERILDKGFAFVTDSYNRPILDVQSARQKNELDIHFKDGIISVSTPRQGSLL